jgi:CheY-like chemotaxis protein
MSAGVENIENVLMADDNQEDVELTLATLKEHRLGSRMTIVGDGAEALDYLYHRGKFKSRAKGPPVLVLLDNRMPKIHGLEVLKTIRADEQLKAIPVVMLVSSGGAPELAEFYKQGMSAYLVKPLNFAEFMKTSRRLGVFLPIKRASIDSNK